MRKRVPESKPTRRDAIQAALATVPLLGFNWEAYPSAQDAARTSDEFDAVIIGSGLGGLSCAAAFARKGYRLWCANSTTSRAATPRHFAGPADSPKSPQWDSSRTRISTARFFPSTMSASSNATYRVTPTCWYACSRRRRRASRRAAERNSGAGLQHEPVLLPGVSRLEKRPGGAAWR